MRHAVKLCALLLLLSALPCLAAKEKAPAFRQPLESLAAPLAGPPSWNKGEVQGTVTTPYISLPYGALEVSLPGGAMVRFECNQEAVRLGCDQVDNGDQVKVHYSLRGILAPVACGLWDGVMDVADLVLLYRWTQNPATGAWYWKLLTTP